MKKMGKLVTRDLKSRLNQSIHDKLEALFSTKIHCIYKLAELDIYPSREASQAYNADAGFNSCLQQSIPRCLPLGETPKNTT